MSVELRLDRPGSLPRPGVFGRGVRLLFGVACAYLVYQLFLYPGQLIRTSWPNDFLLLFWVVFGFSVFPYVVNIGFSRNWKRWTQVVLLALVAGTGILGIVRYGSFWAPPLGTLIIIWMVYLYGHLGVSFLLSGILGTPGCEMRSIPSLWTIVTGRETAEHHCPGLIGSLDRWEAGRKREH